MAKFDISKMQEHNGLYFFPKEYHDILISDIMKLNYLISIIRIMYDLPFIDFIYEKNIKIAPVDSLCYYFSVLSNKPYTPTGKPSKYPQEVTVFAFEDMDKKPYWNGRISYCQNGEIGKGELIYHIPFNCGEPIASVHIRFSQNLSIKKVVKVVREGMVSEEIFPKITK